MNWIWRILSILVVFSLLAQSVGDATAIVNPAPAQDAAAPAYIPPGTLEYVCPMHPNIRSGTPDKCRLCGMTLIAGIPDLHEYPVHLSTVPKILKAGASTNLRFRIEDPAKAKPVQEFEVMHEKLYHLFIVSQDMSSFIHTHPEKQPDGSFKLDYKFPKAGLYRVLSDFYPAGGTPQLISNTLIVPGAGIKFAPANLQPDLAPQHGENLDVELAMQPQKPIAGEKVLMMFHLRPKDIEPYLGISAHMMAGSWDLIEMIHAHPIMDRDPEGTDYKEIQFEQIFAREGIYRVWIQFQRKGIVNTVAFNVPVTELR
jgi:hypothetical protein